MRRKSRQSRRESNRSVLSTLKDSSDLLCRMSEFYDPSSARGYIGVTRPSRSSGRRRGA